ncbi:expressed unknown protein [Seminavis robusta]|uniref:Uncharacterized protein n=1 Tax=Seminavis robusta TaxID=568900 RepID=A0A9N8H865_9STRA|nr:expressed unknown protein [Seminavis robusta]|eukprot:Sro206_g086500.1 n/a (115) ;mRNA; r:28772-29116
MPLARPPVVRRPSPASIEPLLKLRRREFLLFVRVLIKCIEQSNNYKLTMQTKALVAECVKRNRMGDPHFTPLQDSMALRLRGLVGPQYWTKAKECMHSFQSAKKQATRRQITRR